MIQIAVVKNINFLQFYGVMYFLHLLHTIYMLSAGRFAPISVSIFRYSIKLYLKKFAGFQIFLVRIF